MARQLPKAAPMALSSPGHSAPGPYHGAGRQAPAGAAAPAHGPVLAIAVEVASLEELGRPSRTSRPGAGPATGAFSSAERDLARRLSRPEQWLAQALAVKRAVAKALGLLTGPGQLAEVEVTQEADGRWSPHLAGGLSQRASLLGVTEFAVTSDLGDDGSATATVIALGAH